jgi:hypothetical protein
MRISIVSRKGFATAVEAVFMLLLFFVLACSAHGQDALAQLNWRRTHVGLPAFRPDPRLQIAAERSARAMAREDRMFHNSHIGRRSGIGMTGSVYGPRKFKTCYSFAAGSSWAGAAAVRSRSGRWYFALDLR